MDKRPINVKFIVGSVIGIVIVVGTIFLIMNVMGGKPTTSSQTGLQNDAGMNTVVTGTAIGTVPATIPPAPATTSGGTTTSHPKSSPVPTVVASTNITISLLTPVANNTWKIGQPNPIAWSNEADVTGEIDLLDAQTKKFIGVIDSETGAHQTSYSWDARSIYASRYSPIKKDVAPGTYSIRIKFDGNGLSSLVSGAVTISN